MRRLVIALAVLLLALGCAAPAGARAAPAGPAPDSSLALAMLRQLSPNANLVVSPASLATALAMVDQGASGQTAEQLDAVLGAGSPREAAQEIRSEDLHHAVSAYGRGGPTLKVADGLWLQSGLTLRPSFSDDLELNFGARAQAADFSGDPAAAIDQINHWISARTAGLIPTLMGPGDITAHTNLVLADAVYLNARWQTPFDPHRDTLETFHAPSGAQSTTFMNSGDLTSFPYASGSGFAAVALPYAHSSLQFLAVMPEAGDLGRFTRSLTARRLATITDDLHTRELELAMPKFSLSFRTALDGFLQSQGITRAFSGQSQLDRMIRGRTLAIDSVEQAAVLKVAETGTVAAAATGISVDPTAAPVDPISLRLDHPFLVFLRDTRSGTILFAARVENPSAS